MNKINSDYFPLLVASLLSSFLALLPSNFSLIDKFISLAPGLLFGFGLFFFFMRKSHDTPYHLLKGIVLVLCSILGYYAAYEISITGSIFLPFLSPILGCYIGSLILSYTVGKFWNLNRRNITYLTNWGGIMGFVLCIPISLILIGNTLVRDTSIVYFIVPVVIWQVVMSIKIAKTISINENGTGQNINSLISKPIDIVKTN